MLLDTLRSALTGRHPPAARDHSHLYPSERVLHLLSAWFQRVTGALMKGGRHDRSKTLPVRPSLDSLRKQAKKLARDVATSDAAALARVRAVYRISRYR